MVRGSAREQERAVARAVELGVNYFDTAAMYGNGESERNLGRVLAALRPDVLIASKVRLERPSAGGIGAAMTRSLEASLQRLGRERIDVFQLHNPITVAGGGDTVAIAAFTAEVVPTFQALREAGKIGYFGCNALGETAATLAAVGTGRVDTIQVVYNLLNPSAGGPMPTGAVGQDFGDVLGRARAHEMGAIDIRVLAAGALSGTSERHAVSAPAGAPMGTSADYRTDVEQAQRFVPLIREGHANTLVELALRFAVSHPAISTVLVGFSDTAQLEAAAVAIERGPLPPATLQRIGQVLSK